MDSLARALVNVAAFLELSPEKVVHPDAAVRALDEIAAQLARASEAELSAIRRAAAAEEEARSQHGAGPKELAFFRSFMESFGVEGPPRA
jgi:hypothetical protein